jgi:hypothetical protein
MVDLAEIQAAYYMVAATGVLVAAVFYILNLRVSQRNQELMLKAQQQTLETRQAQLFLQLYSQYYNKDFVAALSKLSKMKYQSYDEFWEKYGNVESAQVWDLLSHYFEGAGVLVRKGLIDSSLVSDLVSEEFFDFWEWVSPFVMEYRVKTNHPKTCENQEYLYELLKKSAK